MSSKGFRNRILEVFEDGTALTNSQTQTSLLPSSAKEASFGIGHFARGKVIVFEFSGRISTLVSTPGTLALALRLGTVDVFSSGLMALNVNAQTNAHWVLRGELVCRGVGTGTATTLFPKGCHFDSHAVIGSSAPATGGAGRHLLPFAAAPAVGTGFDFTADQKVDLLATWSALTSSNSVQVQAGHIDIYVEG